MSLTRLNWLLSEMAAVPGRAGCHFTETFCVQARFFQPKNGERIDAMRDWIAQRALDPEIEAVLLVSLMGSSRSRRLHDWSSRWLIWKSWAPRCPQRSRAAAAQRDLPSGGGQMPRRSEMEAQDAASSLSGDIGYLDPPYNQHRLPAPTTTSGRRSCVGTVRSPTALRRRDSTHAPQV